MSPREREGDARRRGISRREALARVARGVATVPLLGGFEAAWGRSPWSVATRGVQPTPPARPAARAVIELWMSGGPTHLDTFDPKPEAGRDYCGPFDSPIETNTSGVRIGELLPLLAKQSHRFSIVRSLTHGVNAHETATYITQTGRRPGGGENGLVYPGFGAVASMLLASAESDSGEARRPPSKIPPYVVLTRPPGRFAIEGFLGLAHKPFATGGDPRQERFAVEGIVLAGVSDERQEARRRLLHELDALGHALPDHPALAHWDRFGEEAYELILGEEGRVFDLSRESDAMRERYGRTTFGQSCLAARRLVEAGVPYVTVHSGGWDTHKRHFESMRTKLPDLDRGFSTLLADLDERGLLESTIVWWCGEFGRSPRILWQPPWNGGRSHYGRCFSAVVAGGGFRGGVAVGSSDARGEEVRDDPVTPADLHAAMFHRLAIDPDTELHTPRGERVRLLPPALDGGALPAAQSGPLKEILS